MRPRRWILLLCLAVVVAGAGLYEGIRRLEEGRHAEKILIATISPLIGGRFDVGKVEFGFFSVYLRDARVSLPLQSFDVTIRDIKVGLSFWKLLTTRGDLSRSISKIILINPHATFSFRTSSAAASGKTVSLAALKEFPVGFLLIKQGMFSIRDAAGVEVPLGDGLDGKMWDSDEGVQFETRGRLASGSRNMSISGLISLTKAPSRLSVRLNKARLAKPLRLPRLAVTAGALDGVCELTFAAAPDSANVEATGWLHVGDATITLSDLSRPVEHLSCRLAMEGSRWTLDSLSCTWFGASISGTGVWDVADRDTGKVTLSASAIQLRNVAFPKEWDWAVGGKGWLQGELRKVPGVAELQLHLLGGGLSLLGRPMAGLSGSCRIADRTVTVDSLHIGSPAISLQARGTVDLADSLPGYHLSCRALVDTLPPPFTSAVPVQVEANVRGRGTDVQFDLDGLVQDLRIGDIRLGTHRIAAARQGQRLSFWTVAPVRGGLVFSGFVDSLSSKHQQLFCTVDADRSFLAPVLAAAKVDAATIDSCALKGVLSGTLPLWQFEASLAGRTSQVHGGLTVAIGRSDTTLRGIAWRLSDHDLTVNDTVFPVIAAGRLDGDTVSIDSLFALGGLSASGSVVMGRTPGANVAVKYSSVSLVALARWFLKGSAPVDSGTVSGYTRLSGPLDSVCSSSNLHVRGCSVSGFGGLATDAVVTTRGSGFTVLPLVIRKGGRVVASLDTTTNVGHLRFGGVFEDVDAGSLIQPFLQDEDHHIGGSISGSFTSTGGGFPATFSARASVVTIDTFAVDSVELLGTADQRGVRLTKVSARDGARVDLYGSAIVPWSFLSGEVGEGDTLRVDMNVRGDLLASLEKNVPSPIGGHGMGNAVISLSGTHDGWHCDKASISIPAGTLTLVPFVLPKITDFTFEMTMDDSSRVQTVIEGMIKKKPIRIYSTHEIPHGYEPLTLGPIDFGVLLVSTPKHGVELHLPGFQEIGEPAEIEFAKKGPFPDFAVSGPLDHLKLTGTWVIDEAQFTFPFLNTHEIPWTFDPFPYVAWDMDLKVGSQNVMYFWDLESKTRRKLMRFVEGYLDPVSLFSVRGRDLDKTFRLLGSLRSYRGSVFFGKVFERRFEAGLDFVPQPLAGGKGYDNLPIIWGSAEAYSDSSRFQTIKLTLQLSDPLTGGVSERGRIMLVPAKDRPKDKSRKPVLDSMPNFIFHLSSDFDQVAGESEREFYKETGLQFTTIEGAGQFVGDFGEQYVNRYFLQRMERQLARSIGLDVINIETSVASNYFSRFYNRQTAELMNQWDMLALANLGVTVGRYFFHDNLFVKARGQLVPQDQLLVPEYSLGVEVQPVSFLLMDFNYGISKGETSIVYNPQLNLQLRLPIANLRRFLKF
jgi:hypothetical protein